MSASHKQQADTLTLQDNTYTSLHQCKCNWFQLKWKLLYFTELSSLYFQSFHCVASKTRQHPFKSLNMIQNQCSIKTIGGTKLETMPIKQPEDSAAFSWLVPHHCKQDSVIQFKDKLLRFIVLSMRRLQYVGWRRKLCQWDLLWAMITQRATANGIFTRPLGSGQYFSAFSGDRCMSRAKERHPMTLKQRQSSP